MFHKIVLQHVQGAVGFLIPFNCKFTTESSSKKLKSVKIWQNYGQESVAPLFWPTLYMRISKNINSTLISYHAFYVIPIPVFISEFVELFPFHPN